MTNQVKEGLLIVYLTVQNDIRGGGRRYLAVVVAVV